ncbi:class I SAM-dependent methyltransferase [Catellatospora tritici]|uniref:class I SAM-dependent methyltransferase n=1 Tax=Catellatospora tritici TaxID=2851566 RepID=UPI001C2D0399|nr:class I SAM-dependent methyltransferase [Catellatospora tritici]MBV1855288.1 methyltransferase domain-containing protein [Catellatospora tritici]
MSAAGSRAEFAELQERLLGELTGTVLEIGAGRGRSLPLYPREVRWLGLEPDPQRRAQLTRIAARHGRHEPVLAGVAERIPLPDASVDAVVGRTVLCSVADQAAVLAEVRRVLRPGGVYVFFEHVAAPPGSWLRRLQQLFAPLSRRLYHGCDPTRETWRSLETADFSHLDLRWYAAVRWDLDARYIGGTAHR